MNPRDKLLSSVDRGPGHGPHGDCWLWTGSRYGRGYGSAYIDGVQHGAHRLAYELFNGLIPRIDGIGSLFVCHTCDTPLCVNPDHLFLSTHQGNVDDKVQKGRQCRGETHGRATLRDDDVRAIRRLYAAGQGSQSEIARVFGTTRSTVADIVRRRTWTHLD